MNPTRPHPPSDDELDRLLARRYHDTSPEFEARWVALKRELRSAPAPRAWWSSPGRLAGWLGGLGAAAAVALLLIPDRPPAPELTPQVRELLALDAALDRARPLLDEETRAALLHLPAPRPTRP